MDKDIRLLYIDLFCGAGDTSTGCENAVIDGRKIAKVIACVNHDANAIASHKANHPDAIHYTEDIRTLDLSGERGEESRQRAGYAILEPDKADLRNGKHAFRHVDRLRPIRDWKERQIWDILEKYRVRPHPCYFMGFGRCSCKFCVFGNQHQFASAACISRHKAERLIAFEKEFGTTLKRDTDLRPSSGKDGRTRR